jgi:hypothetical protein
MQECFHPRGQTNIEKQYSLLALLRARDQHDMLRKPEPIPTPTPALNLT